LRKGHFNIIALVLPDSLEYMVTDPVASQFIKGVAEALRPTDTNLLLFSGSNETVNEVIDFVDGFICYGAPRNTKLLEQLGKIDKKVVTVDFDIPGIPSVNIDNHDAAYHVAKLALEKNAKLPAILGLRLVDSKFTCRVYDMELLDVSTSISHRRLDGYVKAIEQNCLSIDNDRIWHVPESNQQYASIAAKEALTCSPRPDVLICMSDVIALSAMREALKLGLRIPDDIRIVGFDGIDEAKRYHPTLTTVQQFSDKKGFKAANMFITGENEGAILPYEIIIGEST
jgi:DNA-binding LacI/PurR family transcriptional regulator